MRIARPPRTIPGIPMPLIATCPSCRQSYQVSEQFAGRKANCQSCGQPFVVPQPAAVDALSEAAELQGALSPISSNEYGLAPVSSSPNPLGRGAATFGASSSAGAAYGTSAYSSAGTRDGGGWANSSAGEAVEWAMKPGITCSILGVGGFLLPLIGVQFKLLQLLGPAAPIVAGLLAIAGAGFLFLALQDNLIKALAASGTVVVLAFGAFVIATLASGAPQPANNLAQPLARPGNNQPVAGAPPGAPNNMPMNAPVALQQPGGAAGLPMPLAPDAALGAPADPARPPKFVTPDQQLDPASDLPPLNLEPPTVALPRVALAEGAAVVASGNLRPSRDRNISSFRDAAPAGGWLVGLRVVQSRNWGGAIHGIQPIYQVEGQYVLGELCGKPDGVSQTVRVAHPGFAVSAMRYNAGLVMNALQLEFRQVSGQRMVSEGAYASEWIGCEGGDAFPPIDGQGEPLVGLDGTAKDDLLGLRLMRVLSLPKPQQSLPDVGGVATRGPLAGMARETEFSDQALPGAMLVGLRVYQGESFGGAIRALEPIYQLGDRYVVGGRQGGEGGAVIQLLAPSGYAVGRIQASAGSVLNLVQLDYYRVSNRNLDPQDIQTSSRAGCAGGRQFVLEGSGKPIVGIFGHHQLDLISLGVLLGDR
jgi:hypothetical protein